MDLQNWKLSWTFKGIHFRASGVISHVWTLKGITFSVSDVKSHLWISNQACGELHKI